MAWLNYHHLYYFWVVAREGSIVKATETLNLTQPTISAQLQALEEELGEKLFSREGRKLVLTDTGRLALRYADEIFVLGRELLDTLSDRPTGSPMRVTVGIADVVPKPIAHRLVSVALEGDVRVTCREDDTEKLLALLALHELDVVITDRPVASGSNFRLFSHLLGESAVTLFGTPKLATPLAKNFPASLEGAPVLLPMQGSDLRRQIDSWLDERKLRPRIVGEFEDNALMNVFGMNGSGVFPGAAATTDEIVLQYRVKVVGQLDSVRERYYAVTGERRIKNPAVVAMTKDAPRELFG